MNIIFTLMGLHVRLLDNTITTLYIALRLVLHVGLIISGYIYFLLVWHNEYSKIPHGKCCMQHSQCNIIANFTLIIALHLSYNMTMYS